MKWKIIFVMILSLVLIQASYAQKSNKKIKITGVVVDASSRPVVGAIIMVDEEKTDVVTNSSGEYTIKVLPTAKTITVLSLFDNIVKATDINGKTVVNIILDKAGTNKAAQLTKENESVDIGYGTTGKKRSSNSGSRASLNNARSKPYTNIYDMIKSEVRGVQVIGTSIRLQQGTTSLTSPTEPLFVVDGTIVDQINGLIPSQVRSISLLKGSATSIYGSRGANGVLVFTTYK
jgi:TonB-dependent SusC/RagA subfamily outer membrane receptor